MNVPLFNLHILFEWHRCCEYSFLLKPHPSVIVLHTWGYYVQLRNLSKFWA